MRVYTQPTSAVKHVTIWFYADPVAASFAEAHSSDPAFMAFALDGASVTCYTTEAGRLSALARTHELAAIQAAIASRQLGL